MLPHKATVLSIACVVGLVVVATPPALGHIASIKSTVSLNAGYGYFEGKVGSPNTKCRWDRSVKLFQESDGTDPLLKTVKTNSAGAWALFRPYEEGSFYVKVPARILRPRGHTHTCKATRSADVTAPIRVTPDDSNGWNVVTYDCLEYASNPQTAAPIGSVFSAGPEQPPLGFGSLQLINPDATFGFSFTQARWGGLDGSPLSSLKKIGYGAYVTGSAPPPTVKIFVDVMGDGSTTEELSFTPTPSAVITDRWQTWTAGRSQTWITPGGPISLNAYLAANPSAEFEDSQSMQLWSDCPDGGTELHYMDAVIVQMTSETVSFDFER